MACVAGAWQFVTQPEYAPWLKALVGHKARPPRLSSTGRGCVGRTVGAPPHDWLNNMGGSIGYGTPVAVGAAVACPDRPVIGMTSLGSSCLSYMKMLRAPLEDRGFEVAVFHAFSRIVSEARSAFVVLDTAPTGHSLLLMDATGAYHRQMTREFEGRGAARVVTPLMRLQDAAYTKIILVTLPEVTVYFG